MPGPGSHLKQMLGKVGFTPTRGCVCDKRAAQMDVWGPKGCRRRLYLITDWLHEEWNNIKRATADYEALPLKARAVLQVPFVRRAAELLVLRAIKKAERDERAEKAERA